MKKNPDGDELFDIESRSSGGHTAGIAGAIALAAVVGLGVGLLAAPQTGERTRKALRSRLASLGEDLEEGLEDWRSAAVPRASTCESAGRLRDRGGKMIEDLEERLERLEGNDDSGSNGIVSLLTFAAGLAATYLITSEQTAPTRAKVRDAATDIRRRATDRWDRFQERRHSNGGASAPGSTSGAEAESGEG